MRAVRVVHSISDIWTLLIQSLAYNSWLFFLSCVQVSCLFWVETRFVLCAIGYYNVFSTKQTSFVTTVCCLLSTFGLRTLFALRILPSVLPVFPVAVCGANRVFPSITPFPVFSVFAHFIRHFVSLVNPAVVCSFLRKNNKQTNRKHETRKHKTARSNVIYLVSFYFPLFFPLLDFLGNKNWRSSSLFAIPRAIRFYYKENWAKTSFETW